jgi:hypothetical protein
VVVERLRAVVAERLRAAQGVAHTAAKSELEPAAFADDDGLAQQLMAAIQEGDGAGVSRLLAAGADPNALVPGQMPSGEVYQTTALVIAVANDRIGGEQSRREVARLLLEGGADLDRAGGDGYTPLMSAAANGYLEVLRLLLAWGAAVDAVDPRDGWTAFHTACVSNQAECAEALARAGCDVGIKTNNGKTGQQVAEAQGNKKAARRMWALACQPFVGVLVELAGLVGAAEHNGKRAMVMSTRPSCSHRVSVFLALASCLHSANHRSTLAMRGSRMAVELTLPPCGARCCATCQRSSATRWSCWSRRSGVVARGSAWKCGRRTLCWHTCRPARGAPPGGCDGSRSPVTSA